MWTRLYADGQKSGYAKLQLQYETLLHLFLTPCSRTLWTCRGARHTLRCDFSSTGLSSSVLPLRWTLSPLSFSAFLLYRHWSWHWDELASWKVSVPQAISSSSPQCLHLSGQLLSAGAPRPLHRSASSPGPPFLGQGGGKVAVMHIWLDTKASPVFHEWTVKSAVLWCGVKNHSWSKVNVASPRLSSSLSICFSSSRRSAAHTNPPEWFLTGRPKTDRAAES